MNWKKYGFEFLSIFVAVLAAFALNNWNDHRKNDKIESKILMEIYHGLEKDIEDVLINKRGHEIGIISCDFWRRLIKDEPVSLDTLMPFYFNLMRDYISIQNISGYESLKSKGLELIDNDSLRFNIIKLYEYDYQSLRKFEEEYHEMQFHKNYFNEFNDKIGSKLEFDEKGDIIGITLPLNLKKEDKNLLLSLLWKIKSNREFILPEYERVENKIIELRANIKNELRS